MLCEADAFDGKACQAPIRKGKCIRSNRHNKEN